MIKSLAGQIKTLFPAGSVRGDAANIYILQFLTLMLSLGGSILIARTLGPTQKGVVDLYNLLNSFIVEFGLVGVGYGLLYFPANKGESLSVIHGTGILLVLILGGATILIGIVGLPLWRSIFPGLQDWIILLCFLLSPVSYYRLIGTNILTGLNQAVLNYRIGLLIASINIFVVLVFWWIRQLNASNVIGLLATLAVLNSLTYFVVLLTKTTMLHFSYTVARNALGYGFVLYIGAIANILHFKVDLVMINYWLGATAVGIYALSVRWAEMLFLLDGAIIAAALYKISSSSVSESYRLSNRIFKIQLIISGGAGLMLAIFAYPLIRILYGTSYIGAVKPLIFLIPGIVAWSSAKVVSGMLVYNQGLTSYVAFSAIIGSVVNIILNYFFLRILSTGIAGAALASTVSYIGVALLILFKQRQLVDVAL